MKALFNKITLILGSLFMAGGLSLAVATVPVHAQDGSIQDSICQGVKNTGTDSCTDNGEGDNSFASIIKKVINIFSVVVGAVSVIMIIIGGFRYIISNGDSNGVTGAKNTILYAIVGLVIVLFAQVIVRFVLTKVSSNN